MKVVELFAGVGGFRVGLERASKDFKTIWANQWEPSTKVQHAFEVYNSHFKGSVNINEDITKVWKDIPKHDLLVGGFPCQDYSVAQGNKAKGIQGKKGVLWWEIRNIIEYKKPKFVLLENVDRLLNSPTSQRGRDFAIIIRSLNDLGYIVEWKTIKASDYGFPQKRRRVFIYAYRSKRKSDPTIKDAKNMLLEKAFPSKEIGQKNIIDLGRYRDLVDITNNYSQGRFQDCGISINSKVTTFKYTPKYDGSFITFSDIQDKNTQNYIYLTEEQKERAAYMKSNKKIARTSKTGHVYNYTEGAMSFPENKSLPGRTMLTSEGTINRSTHFYSHGKKVRFITPIEAERMNGFPDNWTDGQPIRRRFFFMGNALVTGIVTKIGKEIIKLK